MDPSARLPATGNQLPLSFSQDDDDTVVTPTKGETSESRGLTVEEKTLKFRFPLIKYGSNGNVNPLVLHAHWMHEVQTAFGDGVKFFDNSNRKIGKLDLLSITQESQEHQFSVHTTQTRNRSKDDVQGNTHEAQQYPNRIIIHRMQTKYTLCEIKSTPNVANLMQKYNFYVNEHKWSETDWDTIQLGFFYGVDPQFYDTVHATCKIQEAFKKNVPRAKVPKFRLVYCSPKVRSTKGNNRPIRTKGYAIETLRKDRDEMTRILKQAYKEDGTFVPFQMRSRHPEAFEKMIRAQTHHRLANNFVIVLNHVGPNVKHYISERILATEGVQAVLPGKSVNKDGRYNVLVHKSHYHKTREYFMDTLASWINDNAAPDAKSTLDKYPGPPEVASISSDGFSRGDDSYINISINTAFAIGSAISDSSPPDYVFQDKTLASDTSTLGGSRSFPSERTRTWADMATGHTSTVETPLETGQVSFDQSTVISDLASSRAEVESLKAKVAKMEAQRIEQQKALADTVQEQVSKAVQDQMSIFIAQMTQ
jgi:hypothetical protein